jgi:hypothetical protein
MSIQNFTKEDIIIGLLWTSDQLAAKPYSWQHTTLTTDIHPQWSKKDCSYNIINKLRVLNLFMETDFSNVCTLYVDLLISILFFILFIYFLFFLFFIYLFIYFGSVHLHNGGRADIFFAFFNIWGTKYVQCSTLIDCKHNCTLFMKCCLSISYADGDFSNILFTS